MFSKIFFLFLAIFYSTTIGETSRLSIKQNESEVILQISLENLDVAEYNVKPSDSCENATVVRVCGREIKMACRFPPDVHELKAFLHLHSGWSRWMVFSDQAKSDKYFVTFNTENLARLDCSYCYLKYLWGNKTVYYPSVIVENYDCTPLNSDKYGKYYEKGVGGDISFRCWDMKLEENVTVEWYFKRTNEESGRMQNFEYIKLNYNPTDTRGNLTIANVSTSDAGLYKCYVWFHESHFRHVREFELHVLSAPLPPVYLELKRVSDMNATFAWSTNPRTIKSAAMERLFRVKYYEMKKSDENSISAIIRESSVEIVDLNPFTLYMFEVSQLNAYGESESVKHIFLTNNFSSYKDGYDIEMSVVLNRPVDLPCYTYENVTIGEIVWGYEFKYDFITITDRDPNFSVGGGKLRIEKVEKSHIYACTRPYEGTTNGHRFRIKLSILLPPNQPENLRCVDRGNENVTLTWLKGADPNSKIKDNWFEKTFFRNTITNYRIKFREIGSSESWKEALVSGEQTSHSLKLDRQKAYALRLSSINDAGESNYTYISCFVP